MRRSIRMVLLILVLAPFALNSGMTLLNFLHFSVFSVNDHPRNDYPNKMSDGEEDLNVPLL